MSGLREIADLRAALPALFAPTTGHAAVGLAVSGGADSLALMLLIAEWARTAVHAPRLFVYSVDHGLRAEAAGEAAFVTAQAKRLGLPARILRWEGPKPAAGIQAAARAARYRLIGAAMALDGAEMLLTAHHRDDQAETVLMRLAHGSGLEGLRGMDGLVEVEGVRVFRPLLALAPEALRAVVAEAGLTPIADPSNADRHYERVRWRQAMPQLAELGLDAAAVTRFARRAGEADAALATWAAAAFAELVAVDPLGPAQVSAERLLALPRAVGVKLLAGIVAATGGGRRPHDLASIERLYGRLTAGAAFAGATMLGAAVRRHGDVLLFTREPGRTALASAHVGPLASLRWDGRFRISNHLAQAVQVGAAGALSRRAAEDLLGQRLAVPVAAIRTAPLVRDADGRVLALGAHRLGDGIEVKLGE